MAWHVCVRVSILNLNLKTTKIHTQHFKQMITMDAKCAELETAGNEV